MTNYSNSNVVQYLRQYEMFSNSLHLIKNKEEKAMIIKQLTKLESKIIQATNENYEEEYYTLLNKECGLLDEEKKRLLSLIDLINQRLSYVEKICNDHYQLTGESTDVSSVLGADTLDDLENKVKIIDKYCKNIKLANELKDEIQNLSSKISLASKKIDINQELNIELEKKFKELIENALAKNDLYDLLSIKDEIEMAYYETEKSLTLAELNLESAKTSPMNVYSDCQSILEEVKEDYANYKDKLSLLRLMDSFSKEVSNYQELFRKRKEINDLFKYIKDDDFVNMVIDEVTKQYNTILREQQDIDTFNDLSLEKERKLEVLSEIEEENASDEFQSVLKVLIENENKKEARLNEEKKKLEAEEKKKRLEIEKKKQEEILKRQKIIEEARKKEIEKRTKVLLEQQQNSVLQGKKIDKDYSFSTIKDNIDKRDNEKEMSRLELYDSKESLIDQDKLPDNENNILNEEKTFKDKKDIERELFDEFNGSQKHIDKDNVSKLFNNELLDDKEQETQNKLPDVSLDEYMKNFNENDISNVDDFFSSNDTFPSIPL